MDQAPAIVLLHGFTNSGASWAPVVSGLGERYRALTPDIRGHAGASHLRPVTLDAVISDLSALAPPSFALAGYSQGGRIALHAALALAGRVSALVLIGASPGIADARERAERRAADERLASRIEQLSIERFAQEWARTPVLSGAPAEVQAAAHADRLRSTPAGLAAALRGLGTGALPSLWERLSELTMPVTLISGERDLKFTELAQRMAAVIPQARVVVVPGAGHAVHLEAPQAVVRELERVIPADQSLTQA